MSSLLRMVLYQRWWYYESLNDNCHAAVRHLKMILDRKHRLSGFDGSTSVYCSEKYVATGWVALNHLL
jgi:hypothetical protein